MALENESRAVIKKKKKDRTANWHDNEIRALLSEVEENKEGLFAPLSQAWTSKRKTELWRKITSGINSRGVGNQERDLQQVKKKWTNMKATAISRASARKQISTGGGPKECEEWWIDAVLDIVGRESASVVGINPTGCIKESRLPFLKGDNHSDTRSQESGGDAEEITILHMTKAVEESDHVLIDLIAPDLPHDLDNDECSEVCFQPASKRAHESLDNQPILAKKAKTNVVGQRNGAPGSSQAASGSASSMGTATTSISAAVNVSGSQVDRLRQLQHRKCKAAQSEKKGIEVMEMEMNKIRIEQEYFQEKLALARIHKTNAKMQQLKLYYEIKKLEDDFGVPNEHRCKNIFHLDVDPLE